MKLRLTGGLLCLFVSLSCMHPPNDGGTTFWNAYPYKVCAITTFDTGIVEEVYIPGKNCAIVGEEWGRLSALRIETTTGELLVDYPSHYVARIAFNYANDEKEQQWVLSTKGLFKVSDDKWKSFGKRWQNGDTTKAFAYYNSDAAVEELRARIGEVILP